MCIETVRTDVASVIGEKDDNRIVELSGFFQLTSQLSDHLVDFRNPSKIAGSRVPPVFF